ncbi:hypothetical protein CEXT_250291 [Caerostris extrusa]|uniref:Uncharacterized protein n=1 Tax=Caerostris extrusa TaxID=172846 RepID=A0AAV4RME5_CAEEX|nr:hypothetical protein CEXT_250291 [Caerostris extrusa]
MLENGCSAVGLRSFTLQMQNPELNISKPLYRNNIDLSIPFGLKRRGVSHHLVTILTILFCAQSKLRWYKMGVVQEGLPYFTLQNLSFIYQYDYIKTAFLYKIYKCRSV